MIYNMIITVARDEDEAKMPITHRPVSIRTLSDGGVLPQTEEEQEMVAEAFKKQVLDLIKFMSPVKTS